MKSYIKVLLGQLLLSLICLPLLSQSDAADTSHTANPEVRVAISGGYLLGGQFFNESFSYNPGFSLEVAAYKKLSETVNLGGGVGVNALMQGETFIPLFVSFMGFTRPQKAATYFLMNAGYSISGGSGFDVLEEYDLRGGPMFQVGLGRRFLLGKHDLLFGLSFRHQWARGRFESAFGQRFEEPLNYDFLVFELRFLF
ncbi:MAG: hypothetical protein EA392_03575 [Cryomorphaceae bacterium]|nr:MAG: hypothetical protein EA392_03575 [Cryomorphaceae bacterium]